MYVCSMLVILYGDMFCKDMCSYIIKYIGR